MGGRGAEMRTDTPASGSFDEDEIRPVLAGLPTLDTDLVDGDLYDRLHGGWLGRCIGCVVGSAYASQPNTRFEKMVSDSGVVRDELLDLSIERLTLLETYGLGFDARDVGETILPEGVRDAGVAGAELWGYVFPGQPRQAAELALRYAAKTGSDNEVYGAVFASVMVSAAFSTGDVDDVAAIAASSLPASSDLSVAVENVRRWWADTADWSAVQTRIATAYGGQDVVENVCWILLGTLGGRGDFAKTIEITAQCDTAAPLSTAAVGSILGVMNETFGIPNDLKAIGDRFESQVAGNERGRISDLGRRTLDVVRRLGTNP